MIICYGPANNAALNQDDRSQVSLNVCFFSRDSDQTADEDTAAITALIRAQSPLHRTFDFAGIERRYHPIIHTIHQQTLQEAGTNVSLDYDLCYQYDWTNASLIEVAKQERDDNIRLKPLACDDNTVNTIAAHWKYASPSTPALLMRLISTLPSIGAFDGDELVGWSVTQVYGATGMTHVKEGYRQRGIAQRIIRQFCIDAAARRKSASVRGHSTVDDSRLPYDEFTPFCYINQDNLISKRLFESVGFTKTVGIDWITWKVKKSV